MPRIFAIVIILCCWVVSSGQTDSQRSSRSEEIKMALEKLRQSGERTINGVLFDMRTFDGKLIRTEENTFTCSRRSRKRDEDAPSS